MRLYFCYYIFFGALISGEVITLIKDNKVLLCILTENSINLTLDVRAEEGFNNVHRRIKEIKNWEMTDWILENSTGMGFSPVLDQRWTNFALGNKVLILRNNETFSVCSTNEWNMTVSAFFGWTNVTILKQNKSSCLWQHYTPTKNGNRIILSIKNNEIINRNLNFEPLRISFPNHINYKLHRYTFLFANTSTTKISYININSTKCIAFYISVDIGCYLNVSLRSKHMSESITVIGFNKKNLSREWKKYEIRSETDTSGNVSFIRGRNDGGTFGFWAIDDIHYCDSEIVIYEASIKNKTWRNQTCKTLDSFQPSNKLCNNFSFGKQCQLKCSTILGSSYSKCEKHRICLAGKTCYCAWGYMGTNCSEGCGKNSWGLDCKENCTLNCETCDPAIGCTKCRKKYFGADCAFKFPVLRKPPYLESLGESSAKFSIHFEYGEHETNPESFVIQMKKHDTEEMFRNISTVRDYPGNRKIPFLINLTRKHSYQLRVILISHNLSFQGNIVPELIIHKTSLKAHIKDDGLIILTWSEIGRQTVDSYDIHYECNKPFCSTETEKGSKITKGTVFELKNTKYFQICNFRLFARIQQRVLLVDQIVIQNLTRKIQDIELPKNITLIKNYILIELDECNKLSGPLNYSLELTCISRWCINETTKTVSFQLTNYHPQSSIDVDNLYPFTNYNITIIASRLDQGKKYLIYSNKSTPSSESSGVEDLFVHCINNSNLYIKWKEPYPPRGQIEFYSVIVRQNRTTRYTNMTFPCKTWSGFVCANISRVERFTNFNVTVQSKNYHVSEWSAATSLFIAIKNVTDAPQILEIKLNSEISNDMIISWVHPVYTYGRIEKFHILIDDGKEIKCIKKKIQTDYKHYIESIRFEYGKKYNVSIWAQNIYSTGKKTNIYVIVSKPIFEFSTTPALIWCGTKCHLVLPKSQETKSFNVLMKNSKEIGRKQGKVLNNSLEDKVLCTQNDVSCDFYAQMEDVLNEKYFLQLYNETFPIDFTVDDSTIKKSVVPTVMIVSCTILVLILLLGVTFYYYVRHRQKPIFKESSNTKVEHVYMSEFEENQKLIENNNKNYSLCTEINISDFKNYLFTSLDDDPDDNKIIQQFKAIISKLHSTDGIHHCTKVNENYDTLENTFLGNEKKVILNNDKRGCYVNLNYINGYEAPNAYFATKSPLPSNVHDFWSRVCQEDVKTIVMLTKLEEDGCIKCGKYWPDEYSHFRFGKFLIESVSVKFNPDYVHRLLEVKCDNKTRMVDHFQYITWSNKNVPLSVKNFTSFLRELSTKKDPEYPVVIHCDEGCGRTGIYILCDIVLRMSVKEGKVNFFKTFENMANQRDGLLRHLGQYIFCHFVVLEYYFGRDYCNSEAKDNFELKIQEALQEPSLTRLVNHLDKVTKEYYNSVKSRSSKILSGSTSVNLKAVTVDSFNYPRRFIVTKLPVSNTVEYFWNLVVNYEIEIIVSLNQTGHKSRDCPRFWPTNDAQQNWLFDKSAKLTFLSEENSTDVYDVVTVKIDKTNKDEAKIVKIINVKTWKHTNVKPLNIKDLIHVWDKIVPYNGQIVVTCNDGTTASGLFVTLAYLLEKINTDRCCDVFKAAKTVKQSCPNFVENPEQIKFLYQAALEYIREFGIYEVVA